MSRRTKKKIDYSTFCDELEDYSGSDDDFQASPNLPPAKKTRTKEKLAKEKNQQQSKKETNKKNNKKGKVEVKAEAPKANTGNSTRPSLDDKLFQRDLVAALALSKGSSPDDSVIEIEDDLDVVDEKISKTETKVTKQVKDVDEKNIGNEEVKAIGKSSRKVKDDDSDFEPEGENESETDDEMNDEIAFDEDNSDSDYDEPKKKKPNKTVSKKSAKQAPSKSSTSGKSASSTGSSKGKSAKSKSVHNSKGNSGNVSTSKSVSSGTPRIGLTASLISHNTLKSPTLLGNTVPSRTISPGLSRLSPGSGLGGVNIKNTGPTGIRVGLSRNIRITKPLHPNVMIKNG